MLFFFTILLLNKISWGQDSTSLSVQADSTSVVGSDDSLVQGSALVLDSSIQNSPVSVSEPDSSVEALADSVLVPDSSAQSCAESEVGQDSSALAAAVADSQEIKEDRETTGILQTAAPLKVQERGIEKKVFEDTSKVASGSFLKWLRSHLFHLAFIFVCLSVILYTVYFFLKKIKDANARRFLTTTRLSVFDKMVQRTCRYIESNYSDQQLTVESICRDLVTGEAYLEALFEKELGISIGEFIDQVRVNHLRDHLNENPEAEPAQFIDKCGFKDMKTAQKTFSSVTGVTLEEFRESCGEKSAG